MARSESEFRTFCPYRDTALQHIKVLLNGLQEREKAEGVLCGLYDLMMTGEVKWQGKPVQLTEKQQAALAALMPNGSQVPETLQWISDEQREALHALSDEPTSDEEWSAFWTDWQKAWQEAASWARKGGWDDEADGIEAEIGGLPTDPMDEGYRNAVRKAAERVTAVLNGIAPDAADALQGAASPIDPAADESTGKLRATTSVNAEAVGRLLALCGDGRALQILRVARDQTKSVDDRMRALVELDGRHDGFKSKQWADLLDVTEGAIRQAPFWKDREKRKWTG